MPDLELRDRDAITAKEGMIFRVLGYSHPQNAYICDVEYAPAGTFKSSNQKAFRSRGNEVFYKFYEDEGWEFIRESFPQYLISHEVLDKQVLGVRVQDVLQVLKPPEKLRQLVETDSADELVGAMQDVLKLVSGRSSVSTKDFGIFGSMLHGFHHPRFSDIDFIIYGRKETIRLCETLQEFYNDGSSRLGNEFGTCESVKGKYWRFRNLSLKEFLWHQRRKLIYGLFRDCKSGRTIKTEFEPVKRWKEISNEYDSNARISQRGWVTLLARVTDDSDAFFIPSTYGIEVLKVLRGTREALEAKQIISYIEEFRMQVHKDEQICVEGNLEKVKAKNYEFLQIALTYCPRYYEQALKTTTTG